MDDDVHARRKVLGWIGASAAGVFATACGGSRVTSGSGEPRGGGEHDADEGVTATEDVMREHGVLRRVLIVYDECVRKLRARESFDLAPLQQSVVLVRHFVEDYHEAAEEQHIFPTLRG